MTIIKLKQEYIDRIKDDPQLQGTIAAMCGVGVFTVKYRWCVTNDANLTQAGVLQAIRDRYDLPKNTVLVESMKVPEKAA